MNKEVNLDSFRDNLEEGFDLSDYIEEDETEYLMRSETNKKELAINDIENERNLVEVELVDGFYRRKK